MAEKKDYTTSINSLFSEFERNYNASFHRTFTIPLIKYVIELNGSYYQIAKRIKRTRQGLHLIMKKAEEHV